MLAQIGIYAGVSIVSAVAGAVLQHNFGKMAERKIRKIRATAEASFDRVGSQVQKDAKAKLNKMVEDYADRAGVEITITKK